MSTYLTTQDAAAELGVSLRRVQQLIRAGRLKAERFGQAWMIRRSALDSVRTRPNGYPRGRPRKKTSENSSASP